MMKFLEVKDDTAVLIKPLNTQLNTADYLLNFLFLMDSSFLTFYIYSPIPSYFFLFEPSPSFQNRFLEWTIAHKSI